MTCSGVVLLCVMVIDTFVTGTDCMLLYLLKHFITRASCLSLHI